ncbi:NAD-dependent epimerase/dehydratase family protein [Bacteroides fragilis]
MIKVGITGQSGFIGGHLYNELGLFPETIIRIPFEDNYFQDGLRLREFVKQCDVIVHLAAMNRHSNPQIIYETNLCLVRQLIVAMESENVLLVYYLLLLFRRSGIMNMVILNVKDVSY